MTAQHQAIATRYYAVPDPTTGAMTYWRRDRRGRLAAWPTRPQAHYGPQLWSRLTREPGPHDHRVPAGVAGAARAAWVRDWYATVGRPWHDAIRAAIDADPEAALARFATLGSRCACCGRELTDADSKVLGVGPECRRGVPEHLVLAVARAVARLHGRAEQAAAD